MYTYKFPVSQGVWLEARTDSNDFYDDLVTDSKGLRVKTTFSLFRVTDHSEFKLGEFTLAPMPGCCGIVVSTNTWLTKDNQHTGLSNPFRELKHKLAKELGYTVMIATSKIADVPAFVNMLKSKYNIVKVFRNKRTTNDVAIGIKLL